MFSIHPYRRIHEPARAARALAIAEDLCAKGARVLAALLLLICFAAFAQDKSAASIATSSEKDVAPHPEAKPVAVKVIEGGESAHKADECRGVVVGPGVNEPDPFPGYGGFVGWESPIRLHDGTWLVGFNAGYWQASGKT